MAMYGQSMTAIDPDSGQLVEVSIDPNNTYVVQDPGQLLAGGQVQVGGVVQAGKSLLKPELAQHLVQPVGFRSSLPRGGFTQSIVDPRMTQTVQRGNRVLSRKPVGSQNMQILGTHQGGLIQQSAALAPTASGLLSLGTRYTPSSGSTLAPPQNTGGMLTGTINQSGMVAGVQSGQMFTQGTMLSERDSGYRLAAAMTGAGCRGRPRGRRPLRGQFPVVPIDMVRQLGIEQQVILQPAAPVAMRNKAILCRPLSVSRKTQAGVHAREIDCQTTTGDEEMIATEKCIKTPAIPVGVDDDDEEEDAMMVEPEFEEVAKKSAIDAKKELEAMDTDSSDKDDSDAECEFPKKTAASVNTTQTDDVIKSHLGTQTTEDIKVEEEKKTGTEEETGEKTNEKVIYIPIPVPVPIYVPVPVYLYARPIPYAIPFPVPCVIPLPLALKGDELGEKAVVEDEPVDTKPEQPTISVDSVGDTTRSIHKRPPPRDSLQPTLVATTTPYPSQALTSVATPTQPSTVNPAKRQRTAAKSEEPPTTRLASTIVSDANYHLKFSYGINAWRHWVTHSVPRQTIPLQNLHTELLDVADEDLNLALSRFVHEVRKPNNETYVADSIFYLCLGIQEYLNENGRSINLFGNPEFTRFAKALDTVLADFQPRISPEGLLICRIEEEHLWEARQLGSQTPHILLFTLLYFITKHFCLRSGENHCQLNFTNFQMKREGGTEMVYFVPQGSSTRGGAAYPMYVNNEEPSRCPVHLYRAYAKKCPSEVVAQGGPLYLSPLPVDQISSSLWYSAIASSVSDIQIMLNRIKMVKEIQEAFMNSQAD